MLRRISAQLGNYAVERLEAAIYILLKGHDDEGKPRLVPDGYIFSHAAKSPPAH